MGITLRSDAPAAIWNDAYPLGNGSLGAMVFGGCRCERIQLNEETLWSSGFRDPQVNPRAKESLSRLRALMQEGRLPEAHEGMEDNFMRSMPDLCHFESLADVDMRFELSEEAGEYERVLDLSQAVARVGFVHGPHRQLRECFASAPAQCLVYHVEDTGAIDRASVSLTRKDRVSKLIWRCDRVELGPHDILLLSGRNGSDESELRYVCGMLVCQEGGSLDTHPNRLVARGARSITVYVAARTSAETEDPETWVTDTLLRASVQGYAKLREEHVADYRRLFDRFSLRLGSEEQKPEVEACATAERVGNMRAGKLDLDLLETYLTYSRYLLISSSRGNGLPANLQGLWCEAYEPNWGSKYTLNINLEMNYWAAHRVGLRESWLPVAGLIEKIRKHGSEVARDMYGARGFVCHHNTDAWGSCPPADRYLPATPWMLGGAWLVLSLIKDYAFTRDDDRAREYLPIVLDAVQFCLDMLMRGEDGSFVLFPSVSPENTYRMGAGKRGALCLGSTMDFSILHELFRGYVWMVDQLGDEALQTDEYRIAGMLIPDLAKLRFTAEGVLAEWDKDHEEASPGHRHFSPLFAVYPANMISPASAPDAWEASHRLFDRRMAAGSGSTGWSRAWAAALAARLGKPEEAFGSLVELLRSYTLGVNLLNVDSLNREIPVFQIDGNMGALAVFVEMLLQESGGEICLLPALPAELSSGSACGLVSACGCSIDMEWVNGSIAFLVVHGLRNGSAWLSGPGMERRLIEFSTGSNMCIDGDRG